MKLEPCLPPKWAPSGHAQTILGHLLPSPKLSHKGRRVEVPLEDGDKLVGFVQEGSSNSVVHIFHGLAGSTDSTYMHRTSMIAQKMNHTVMLWNHRGCGEGSGLARGPYHSGRAEDLSSAIAVGREMFPHKRHIAIGFSMSGNALLLLLTGKRGSVKPDAAISVNAPIELYKASRLLKEGMNKIYDIKFYQQCRRDILIAQNEVLKQIKLPRLASIYDFDNIYTAPAGGFKNREDYYESCSTYQLLDRIDTPTVVLTAKDDPFVPFDSYQNARVGKNVIMHAEDFGGHMGYLSREKTPYGSMRWQDYALHEALQTF